MWCLALSSARCRIFFCLVIRYQDNPTNTTPDRNFLSSFVTLRNGKQDLEENSHLMTFVGVVRPTIFTQNGRRTSDADTAQLEGIGDA